MLIIEIISYFSLILTATVFGSLTWLFADALTLRIEIKTLMKALACFLFAAASSLKLIPPFVPLLQTNYIFLLQNIALWLFLASFIFDQHSKLQLLIILGIISQIFLRDHALLALQALLVSLAILQIAYHTKHRDLIPLITGFFLIFVAEFFYSFKSAAWGNLKLSGDFLNIFASIVFFYWLWQYLVIRFNLQKKSK